MSLALLEGFPKSQRYGCDSLGHSSFQRRTASRLARAGRYAPSPSVPLD